MPNNTFPYPHLITSRAMSESIAHNAINQEAFRRTPS